MAGRTCLRAYRDTGGSVRWTVLEHGGIIGRDEPVLGRTSVALESSPALAGPSSMTRVMLTIEVNKSTTQALDDRKNLVWSLVAGESFVSSEFVARHAYRQRHTEASTLGETPACGLASRLRLGCEVHRLSQPDLNWDS